MSRLSLTFSHVYPISTWLGTIGLYTKVYSDKEKLSAIQILPSSPLPFVYQDPLPTSPIYPVFCALLGYFRGERTSFPLDLLPWDEFSPFAKKVYQVVAHIPIGECISYQKVAQLAGSPYAARVVGQLMAKNRFLIMIPCHRVIAQDGSLKGFSPGIHYKEALLAFEQRWSQQRSPS